MFTTIDKALIALVMSALSIVTIWTGWIPPEWISEQTVVTIVGLLTPVLVYYTKNKPGE